MTNEVIQQLIFECRQAKVIYLGMIQNCPDYDIRCVLDARIKALSEILAKATDLAGRE